MWVEKRREENEHIGAQHTFSYTHTHARTLTNIDVEVVTWSIWLIIFERTNWRRPSTKIFFAVGRKKKQIDIHLLKREHVDIHSPINLHIFKCVHQGKSSSKIKLERTPPKQNSLASKMRLIQFNSGLRVVLKDVQQNPNESSQRYLLSAPVPAHHSSNSSIATTSSSIKSNGSSSGRTGGEYFLPRGYVSSTYRTNNYYYHQPTYHQQEKTPPVANATPSISTTTTTLTTVHVEVGQERGAETQTIVQLKINTC